MKENIIDCITFFDENYIFDLRYNILKDVVDYFVICESKYNHQGNYKGLNFKLNKNFDKSKIKHLIIEEPFPKNTNAWENQAIQRDFILKKIDFINEEDYILFSDPDEIPDPNILKNFNLKKKYGIFLQKFFNFKFNLFNSYESPWEGTRICKKKNLKSIEFMRQKIKSKNLKYNFFRIDKEKSIELIDEGGWHFNNILSPDKISEKLKTFAHEEFKEDRFSSIENITRKIKNKTDLFERGHIYKILRLDSSYPEYLLKNRNKYKLFIED